MLRKVRNFFQPPPEFYAPIPPRAEEDGAAPLPQESRENLCLPSEAETAHPPDADRGIVNQGAAVYLTPKKNTLTIHRANVTVSLLRDHLGEYTVIRVQGNPDYPLYLVSSFEVHRLPNLDIPKGVAHAVGAAKGDQWKYGNRPAANLANNRGRPV